MCFDNVNEDNFNTLDIKEAVSRCEDIEELKERILPMLKTQQDAWRNKVQEIIAGNAYSKTEFAGICGVSRVTVDKWCKGSIPKNRETFLKIGMAAGYNVAEMNHLLQRYGQYPGLYPKSLEDCVCIFVLGRNYGAGALVEYNYILQRIKATLTGKEAGESETVSTVVFDEQLSKVRDEDELERFIARNITVFANAYHKFYAYVEMNIKANYIGRAFAESIFEMAQIQGWSSSLRQCVSAIHQKKWYPTRNKIISLGLHLSMDHEQIDEMLGLAHMEPLCAKNIFECVIMFILDDAALNDVMNYDADTYDPDELCDYAREILERIELPEVEAFISELPEGEDAWE